jgi:hypothetical protein
LKNLVTLSATSAQEYSTTINNLGNDTPAIYNLTLSGNQTAVSKWWLYILAGKDNIISESNIGYIKNGAVYSVFCNDNITGCVGTCWGTNAFYEASVCPNTPFANPMTITSSIYWPEGNVKCYDPIFDEHDSRCLMVVNSTWAGSYQPYQLILSDWNQSLCYLPSLNSTSFSFRLYPSSGSHYYSVYVEGGDYQYAEAFFDKIKISEYWGGGSLTTFIENCLVNNGNIYNNTNYPVIDTTSPNITQPSGAEQDVQECNEKTGLDKGLCILFNPMIFYTAILIGGAGYAEFKIKSHGKVFGIIVIVGIILLGIFGIYPTWLLILLLIVVGLAVAFLGRKMIGG